MQSPLFRNMLNALSSPIQFSDMNSMNHATTTNGDEAEEPESHLQEVVDEVDLDSVTEEDPLTLDPSTSPFNNPSLFLPSAKCILTPPSLSPRPLPLRPPRNILPSLLVRLDAQTLLRRRRPPQPQPIPVLAIGRSATAFAHDTLLQIGQDCQDTGVFGFFVG